ncbi:hypothetical protein VNO77_11471 [Canavalia gladiata]|uniref:Syringolide-induced protein 14-1-1 n=1 Tax=Canavalia gladiata TaxID=3824 RepID=A0AAN9MGV5_CANGL
MDKHHTLKNKFLKGLPKAVAAVSVTFQNPPFSPGRDHKSRAENNFFLIPYEARKKSHGRGNGTDEIYNQEPTSPKISCMGQIKHKKNKEIKKGKAKEAKKVTSDYKDIEVKKHVSTFQKMLFYGAKPKSEGRKSDASAPQDNKGGVVDRASQLSQMRGFSSGREALANFDWKMGQIVATDGEIDYDLDEERVESDSQEEEEVIIPFSAPILVGGGVAHTHVKPRKEINLWKRRTLAPPRHLQLDPFII